jgi:hypothetical protein
VTSRIQRARGFAITEDEGNNRFQGNTGPTVQGIGVGLHAEHHGQRGLQVGLIKE